MPQISSLYWFFLYIYFLFIYFLVILFLYYMYLYYEKYDMNSSLSYFKGYLYKW